MNNIYKAVLTTVLAPILVTLLTSRPSLADTAVGAFVRHDAWKIEKIDDFNVDTARQAATINVFSSFDHNWWRHLRYQARNIVSRNATPMITWMPYKLEAPDVSILEEIIDGKHNGYLYSWIDGFQMWLNTYPANQQPRILLRFGHEFNGRWFPWGDQPDAFKAAWRYIHRLFVIKGVDHAVDWVWSANNVDVDSHKDITRYYPGDDVVDWVSIDGYNWGSNFSFSSWKSFDETFSDMYTKMIDNFPYKPVMLSEVSTAEPHDLPNPAWGQNGDDSDAMESKELWIADMMQRIKESYPSIKTIVWFNINKELSWGLNLPGNTGLASYNNAVVDEYFSGTLDISPYQGTLSERGVREAQLRKPTVLGKRKLATEAEGLKEMDIKTLRRWRMNSSLPDFEPIDPLEPEINNPTTQTLSGGGSLSWLLTIWLTVLASVRVVTLHRRQ